MKQRKLLILIFLLAFSPVGGIHAQILKMAKVGKVEARIYDHGCQSASIYEVGMINYFRGSYISVEDAYENDYPIQLLGDGGMLFGALNWVDTTGHTWDAMITGHCARLRDVDIYQFAIPDENGYFIRRYMRYPLPQIIVDGTHTEDPFPVFGDEVNPDKIAQWGGTADVMIESSIRLSMGLDVKQRVLAWSQPDHDDYVIWDWTFVNTGNVDEDPEIERPDQTLEDVYITRVTEAMINGVGGNKAMPTFAGTTEYQLKDNSLSYPQDDDSLRIDYITPLRAGAMRDDTYGFNVSYGRRNVFTGARFGGSAVLFAPKSCDVPHRHPISDVAASNDPAQPSMHTSILDEPSWILLHNDILSDFPDMTPQEFVDAYEIMVKGVFGIDPSLANYQQTYAMDTLYDVYDTTASGAKTYYEQPIDRWGELGPTRGYPYVRNISFGRWDMQSHWSIGPYQMKFGDTIRYVYAYVGGAVNRKNSYLGAEAWRNDEAASYDWLAGLDSAQMVYELRRRDPIFDVYYGYTGPRDFDRQPSLNDIAKDLLVATGRDSLFNNGMNAQRNFNKNYNIPASPAPPSVFEVASRTDMIRLTWSYEAGYESNIAKFKIYRALGGYVYEKQGEIVTGDWQLIDSVDGTEDSYEDANVVPAVEYYYAITAVSPAGIESGMFLTMTTQEATLQTQPGTDLDSIRIVPNPLNVNSSPRTRYSEGDGLKLSFVELPGECTITILTESGKLVRTIEHTNGSGTEIWKFSKQFLLTDSDQQPVSGIYIAHIRTPDGKSIFRKFLIVR
jgi:hypothetical protein